VGTTENVGGTKKFFFGALRRNNYYHHCAPPLLKSFRRLWVRLHAGRARVTAQVRLYRNGDAHFAGMIYAVSAERARTLDALLEALTHSAVLCDRTVLPQVGRFLYISCSSS